MKTGKMSLLLISKNVKVIQNTLLSNKIECYNKAVQRRQFCSAKGCTHSLKLLKIHKIYLLDCGQEQQINFLFLRTMMFLEVEMQAKGCTV